MSISRKPKGSCYWPSSDEPKITVLFNDRCPRSPIQLRCQGNMSMLMLEKGIKQVTTCMNIPCDIRPAKSERGATSGSRPLENPGGRCWHSSQFQGMVETEPQLRMVALHTKKFLSQGNTYQAESACQHVGNLDTVMFHGPSGVFSCFLTCSTTDPHMHPTRQS